MNPELIAATVLFGPAAVVLPALALAARRDRRDTAAVRAVLADFRPEPDPDDDPTPPDDGAPAPVPDLAPVIDLRPRQASDLRRAA